MDQLEAYSPFNETSEPAAADEWEFNGEEEAAPEPLMEYDFMPNVQEPEADEAVGESFETGFDNEYEFENENDTGMPESFEEENELELQEGYGDPLAFEDESAVDNEDDPAYETELEEEAGTASSFIGRLVSLGIPAAGLTMAMAGFSKLRQDRKLANDRLLTFIDFTKNSAEKRLFVIDFATASVIGTHKVAHGKNSELNRSGLATVFSDEPGSHKSSLGFYVTGNPYRGKNGLSLRLNGMEPGINGNAYARSIVMHGAKYVKDPGSGMSGRSWGCPAVDFAVIEKLVNLLKGGTCLFIYHSNADYQARSTLAKATQPTGSSLTGAVSVIAGKAGGILGSLFGGLSSIAGTVASGTLPAGSAPVISSPGIDSAVVAAINSYNADINRYAQAAGLQAAVVKGIIAAESGGNKDAGKDKSGYKGLMQAKTSDDQLDPSTSIRDGVAKYQEFKKYLAAAIKILKLSIPDITGEDYLQTILACYNAGHVTVAKAMQYAAADGDWKRWPEPEYYQRALLFTGGYDNYKSCSGKYAAADVQTAVQQKAQYRFKHGTHWSKQADPGRWNNVSGALSPVLRCWIETKRANTIPYLARFLAYYRYFSGVAIQPETEAEQIDDWELEYESAPAVPARIGDSQSAAGYTCYVNIDLGRGNIPLTKTGIFVPVNFNPALPCDIVLYLHGMTSSFPGPEADIETYWTKTRLPAYDFRLREAFSSAGKNCLLVAPSLGKSPNSYTNRLSGAAGGLDDYLDHVLAAIAQYVMPRYGNQPFSFRNLILAAHSAGGSQMRKIALQSNPRHGARLTQCWGFDSLYGGESLWASWALRNPQKQLCIYYLGSTFGHARNLYQTVKAKNIGNISIGKSTGANHYLVPLAQLPALLARL